jgi:hypothetical protein
MNVGLPSCKDQEDQQNNIPGHMGPVTEVLKHCEYSKMDKRVSVAQQNKNV